MTVADLLQQIADDAGDQSGDYTNRARRWLNLVRSDIADEQLWKYAMRPEVTITTVASTYIYPLLEGSTQYDFVAGDYLFNETNTDTITYESLGPVRSADQDRSTTSAPTVWADAGADANGRRQIYLWPIPDAAYTITFPAYLTLTDLDENQDTLSVDPFFGPISSWASTFAAGVRYYHDLNNNEDAIQVASQERRFRKKIQQKKVGNRLTITASLGRRLVNTMGVLPTGRFDPAHFSNR